MGVDKLQVYYKHTVRETQSVYHLKSKHIRTCELLIFVMAKWDRVSPLANALKLVVYSSIHVLM